MDFPTHIKRTRQRELVLDVLVNADHPLNVFEIAELVKPQVSLATVYRILDVFCVGEIVQKTAFNGQAAVYSAFSHGHKHYAICVDCKKMLPLEHCPLELSEKTVVTDGFEIIGHCLEVYGRCAQCKTDKK